MTSEPPASKGFVFSVSALFLMSLSFSGDISDCDLLHHEARSTSGEPLEVLGETGSFGFGCRIS